MQEYTIDKDVRRKVTCSILILSIFIALFISVSGFGNYFFQSIKCMIGIKMNAAFDLFDIIPNIISSPFWYWVLWEIYDKFLWKCKIFKKFHGVPFIGGVWKGNLISSYDKTKHYAMELDVKQTWSHIHFTAKFEKSRSESNIAAIISSETGSPVIYFGFRNSSRDINAHQQTYEGYNSIELDGETMYGKYSNNRPSNDTSKTDGNCGIFTLTKMH